MPSDKRSSSGASPRALFLGLVVAGLFACAAFLAVRQAALRQGTVTIGDDIVVRVDVAATEKTREQGLSGRPSLAPDQGMYFVFDHPDRYAFWMKDMRFPIDLLWIDGGMLADITVNAAIPVPGQELPVYLPKVPVDRVLEVPAGFAQAHGLRIGLPVVDHIDSAQALR